MGRIMTSTCLSFDRKSPFRSGIWNFVLAFCGCSMTFFVYICILLRFLNIVLFRSWLYRLWTRFDVWVGFPHNDNNNPDGNDYLWLLLIISCVLMTLGKVDLVVELLQIQLDLKGMEIFTFLGLLHTDLSLCLILEMS